MCGIAGYLGVHPPNPIYLKNALLTMEHRGPDAGGEMTETFYTANRHHVWLGHRLLRIIDRHGGEQPLHNEDKTIYAVVNGEFYDHEIYRQELIQKGHRFHSVSDGEILIHLYEEYGIDCLQFLKGEFACILWDSRRQRLFAIRDRFGIKPLYYADSVNDGIFLASEMKAFFAMGILANWDRTTLSHIWTHQYPLPWQSLCAGISVVPPGTYLLASTNGLDNGVEIHRYWDVEFPWDNHGSIDTIEKPYTKETAKQLLKEKLQIAVRRRMRSDYPYGVYLSGGIDSACILALCAQESSVVPDSFSVAFSQEEYNEALIATKIATHFTSKHHIIPVSQEDILYNLENSVWYGESLAINGQLPAKYLLSKYVQQQNIRVILSGEGADEALLGYPHFKLDLLEHEPHAHPEIVALFHQENSLTKGVFVPTNSHTQHMHLPNFLRSKLEFGWQLQRWMHGDAIHSRETIAKYDPVHHVSAMLPPIHPVYRANYLWIKLALHSYILRGIGDGMEMAHSIEGRPPFLDHEFFAYATSLPIDAKIHRGREKYILREAMSGLLPEWIRNKPKHPFIAPPILPSMLFSTTTQKSSGVEFIQDTLRSRHVDNIPYMDSNKIREFLDKEIHRPELWTNNLDAAVMLLLSATLLEKRWKEERFGQQAI